MLGWHVFTVELHQQVRSIKKKLSACNFNKLHAKCGLITAAATSTSPESSTSTSISTCNFLLDKVYGAIKFNIYTFYFQLHFQLRQVNIK